MGRSDKRSGVVLTALLFVWQAGGTLAQGTGVPFGVGGEHDPSQPVEITSDSLSVDQLENTALFSGSVLVGQGALRLAAGEVLVIYGGESTGANAIERIEASGGVTVTNGSEAAEGEQAVYRVADGIVELEGDVVLTQGPNAISGDRLRIDLNAGRGTVEGRVQTVVVPGQGQTR